MKNLLAIAIISALASVTASANHFGLMFGAGAHVTSVINSWIGATNGNWSTTSNWSTFAVPNSPTANANISKVSGSSGIINLDINATVNQLSFPSSTSWTISTPSSKVLTFDGASPAITTAVNGTISAPITLNQNLNLNGGSLQFSVINATNKTINGLAPSVTINSTNSSTIVAGTYNFSGSQLTLNANDALGNASGMNIVYTNNVAGSGININNVTSFSNAINFNDTGSQDFYVGALNVLTTISSTMTGNLIHRLNFSPDQNSMRTLTISGDLSGLTSSGGFIHLSGINDIYGSCPGCSDSITKLTGTALTTLSPSMPITIGNDLAGYSNGAAYNGSIFYFDTAGTFSNAISVRGSTNHTTPGTSTLTGQSGITFSGPISINSNQSTLGSRFQWLGTGTISGVMSTFGTGTMTFATATGSTLTLSNVNTFTNPTTNSGTLNVTGSIANTTISGAGTLMGSGTVGPISGYTGTINAYSLVSPSVSQVLTVNGNLTETGAVHNFYQDSSNHSSYLQVNGNVTLNGTVNQAAFTQGTYVILKYTGTRTGSWTTAVTGGTITNDDANKQVIFTVTDPGYRNWLAGVGNWSAPASWSPALVPNSSTIIANFPSGTAIVPTLDINATVNQLNLNSSTGSPTFNGSKTLTFDGVNPSLNSTMTGVNMQWFAPITFNQDTSINFTSGGILFYASMNSNGHNITQTGNSVNSLMFILGSGYTGGGNYIVNSGNLTIRDDLFGGASGPKIVLGNSGLVASKLACNVYSAATTSNNIGFSDTGTNPFTINGAGCTFPGTFTGTLTHDLNFTGNITLTGNWSGFTSTGNIIFTGSNSITSPTFTSAPLIIGTTALVGSVNITKSSISNNINVSGGVSNTLTLGGTDSGNIVINYNNNATTGTTFTLAGTAVTVSGIISSGSGAAVTLLAGSNTSQKITLNGLNTYTGPTTVGGTLEVNGSIGSSSLVTLATGTTLLGSGTVGPTTFTAGTETMTVGSSVAPTATQVLTIAGNLIETGTVTHNFIAGASNTSSRIQVNGNVTLNGTIAQNSYTQGTFPILTYSGTRTGTWTTTIPGGTITNDDTNKQVLLTVTDPGYRTYVGPASGNYSLASNWSPNTVPNSTTSIANLNTASGGGVLTFDISPVLNQLNINSTTQWVTSYSNSSYLTMSGVNPIISSSGSALTYMQIPITFNADTAFNVSGSGNLNFYASALTAASRNFNVNNTGTGSLIFSSATAANITGGNLNILSGNTTISSTQALGGSAGSTIVLSNAGTLTPSLTNGVSGNLANKVAFSDIGTKNFLINCGAGTFSGSFTGTVSHDITFSGCQMPTLAGLTLSGAGRVLLVSSPNYIPSGFNPAIDINIGDGVTGGNMFTTLNSTTSIPNQIKIRPRTTSAQIYNFDAGSGATVAGNLIINPDSNAFAGSVVRMGSNGTSYTISGVMSNGVSGSANVTLDLQGAPITFTGISTATNPVTIEDFGVIGLTGTWNNSSVIIAGVSSSSPGTLYGNGTINGNVTVAGSNQVLKSSNSSPSDTFTINGNLSMNSTAKFKPRAAGGTVVSTLQVNGNVTFGSSATNIVLFEGTVPTHGTYNIIKFTGTRTGTLTAPASPAGSTITYDDTAGAGKVILTVP